MVWNKRLHVDTNRLGEKCTWSEILGKQANLVRNYAGRWLISNLHIKEVIITSEALKGNSCFWRYNVQKGSTRPRGCLRDKRMNFIPERGSFQNEVRIALTRQNNRLTAYMKGVLAHVIRFRSIWA